MSDPQEIKSIPLSWNSHAITNVGKVRDHNEDAMLDRADIGLWVVADGMGGHAAGDVASQMIVDALNEIHGDNTLDRCIDEIEDQLTQVNENLIGLAQGGKKRKMIGSTVVLMLAYESYCIYIWAGDSRMYRLRNKQLKQITTDHSQVEQYVEQNLISREEALWHPHSNMITRAVGATNTLFLDMDIQKMQAKDRYMLCSDGLTKHVYDLEFEDMLKKGNAESVCADLIDMALSRGGEDNVTAIIIDIE